jgi:hypothetical protein
MKFDRARREAACGSVLEIERHGIAHGDDLRFIAADFAGRLPCADLRSRRFP